MIWNKWLKDKWTRNWRTYSECSTERQGNMKEKLRHIKDRMRSSHKFLIRLSWRDNRKKWKR